MDPIVAKRISETLGITIESVYDAFNTLTKTDHTDVLLELASTMTYILIGWIMAEMYYQNKEVPARESGRNLPEGGSK